MEHKLIQGGEEYLPFARSRIKALRATGLKYANQQFEIDGKSVKVRIAGDHEYITISGSVRPGMCVSITLVENLENTLPPPLAIETKTTTDYFFSLDPTDPLDGKKARLIGTHKHTTITTLQIILGDIIPNFGPASLNTWNRIQESATSNSVWAGGGPKSGIYPKIIENDNLLRVGENFIINDNYARKDSENNNYKTKLTWGKKTVEIIGNYAYEEFFSAQEGDIYTLIAATGLRYLTSYVKGRGAAFGVSKPGESPSDPPINTLYFYAQSQETKLSMLYKAILTDTPVIVPAEPSEYPNAILSNGTVKPIPSNGPQYSQINVGTRGVVGPDFILSHTGSTDRWGNGYFSVGSGGIVKNFQPLSRYYTCVGQYTKKPYEAVGGAQENALQLWHYSSPVGSKLLLTDLKGLKDDAVMLAVLNEIPTNEFLNINNSLTESRPTSPMWSKSTRLPGTQGIVIYGHIKLSFLSTTTEQNDWTANWTLPS